MTRLRPARRPGLTLIEMMAVIAVLLILGAVSYPSLVSLKGNADQKAAADAVRGRIADARGMAMEYGQPYRLAISSDGTKIRLAPDTPDFADVPTAGTPSGAAVALETRLDHATAGLTADDEFGHATDGGGWVTVGTFLPDGTCREVGSMIEIHEGTYPPIRIQLRGVSASSRVLHNDAKYGGGG